MKYRTLIAGLLLGLFLIFQPSAAVAEVDAYAANLTMAISTSSTAVTVALAASEIKDVQVWCPTLDALSTASVDLQLNILDSTGTSQKLAAPRGWTDKTIGASEDNAWTQCNSSELSIYCDNTATITITTQDNQAAARAFRVVFLVRH